MTSAEFNVVHEPSTGLHYFEPAALKGVSASRFQAYPFGAHSNISQFSVLFSGNFGTYYSPIEHVASVYALDTELLKQRCISHKNPAQFLTDAICECVTQIVLRFAHMKPYVERLNIPDWENRLFRTLCIQDKVCSKVSKLHGDRFGMLHGVETYINFGIEIDPPTMKVNTAGVGIDGREVVVVKPVSGKRNSTCPKRLLRFWKNEMEIWKELKEYEVNGTVVEGVLVPKELFPEQKRAIFPRMKGDLEKLVRNNKISHEGKRSIYLQLARGLLFIHTVMKKAHRDLKLKNILYSFVEGKIVIKIIDWGLSKTLGTSVEQGWSKGYIPPEYYDGTGKEQLIDNEACDAWSLGLLLWEIEKEVKPDFFESQVFGSTYDFFIKYDSFSNQPEEKENTILGLSRRLLRPLDKERWKLVDACKRILEIVPESPSKARLPKPHIYPKRFKPNQTPTY